MKKLEQLRQESKVIKDKIDGTEERLRQEKNQEKKILKQDIVKKRKERTHRLITRRPILESLIENAEELTDEEITIILEEATTIRFGSAPANYLQ
ncbi:DUF3847 domain-containing protein [Anaerococcus tetradius]|uniref:DUF3847 domain-containing protein n=1 Tax=Anaerococcus tetradius ATCC 35098 TaxID=525255 RepID=C2CH27_9FIRM|nr:DUF3847 domain-containing protein [Anaerococcus tetradius]EEI83093.1 hypothetical protein HMPREF0077_0787 [Anaerococcus tetradius ATCC 35098]